MTKAPATANTCGRLTPVLVTLAITGVAIASQAQAQNSLFSATPSTGLISPVPSTRSDIFGPSNLQVPAAPPVQSPTPGTTTASIPVVPAGQVALALSARFGKEALPISGGLTWRVYGAKPDATGNYKLVKEDKSPSPTLVLPAG